MENKELELKYEQLHSASSVLSPEKEAAYISKISGVASSQGGERLHLNATVYRSKESIESNYTGEKDNLSKSPRETGIHESGHLANFAVLKKIYEGNQSMMTYDWNNDITAKDIVQTAYKQTTGENSLSGINGAREKISTYALIKHCETQGEAFVKASRAGNNDAFASNIWKETKSRYDSIK